MFIKNKKLKQHKNNMEQYNANKAHKEMVNKSGGGLNNILQLLDIKNYKIEVLEQNIARLNIEINDLEKQIIELGICYKFNNSFMNIEINKVFLKEKVKQKFKNLFYIFNIIQFIKFKNIIIILNLIFFLQHLNIL